MASTNQTQQYKLCQWEPNDPVLREDFNSDNLKLETALVQLGKEVANIDRDVGDLTERVDQMPFVYGHYEASEYESQEINLGFQPTVVLALPFGGFIVNSAQMDIAMATIDSPSQFITITSTGFTPRLSLNLQNDGSGRTANKSPYRYVAFR